MQYQIHINIPKMFLAFFFVAQAKTQQSYLLLKEQILMKMIFF